MKPEIIRSVFIDELERNKRLLLRYQKEVDELPKGSIFRRKIGNQEYLYLNYRDGAKVISKFLGKAGEFNTEELRKNLAKREELSVTIKKLKLEQKALEKELR